MVLLAVGEEVLYSVLVSLISLTVSRSPENEEVEQ